MTPVAVADFFNPFATRVLPISMANGSRPQVMVIGSGLAQARFICDELRPFVAAGVDLAAFAPSILTLGNVRGRTLLGVVLCTGVVIRDPVVHEAVSRSLFNCARILNVTERSLMINEYGDSV